MHISELRQLANREEIDYAFLMSALNHYAAPRDKIRTWLKSGALIRVKKGLYIFGKPVAHRPYSPNLLANLIYGPSALSMTYALSYHGFIPETTHTLTSITNNRSKRFDTPIGTFTYTHLANKKYALGIQRIEMNHKQPAFLIASPEKALCDQISLVDKTVIINSTQAMQAYLLHDLRLDEQKLLGLDHSLLNALAACYQDARLTWLVACIQQGIQS